MTVDRDGDYLTSLFSELLKLPNETEWLEFKENNDHPDRIGQYLSGLANSAALLGKANAYLLWGVSDKNKEVVGTSFSPGSTKVGNEELENWLLRSLSPKINFRFYEMNYDGKAARVVVYRGRSRVETVREQEGSKGYACGFQGLIEFLVRLLPVNEVIGRALRTNVPMFPELAVRELVANALIHQDFETTGTGPMIEVFDNRLEITNPGIPLVSTDRFLDSPPKSRNECIASFMRRIGVCEERGSGIDKVVFQSEHYQLPAPIFEQANDNTRCILFAHKDFKDMDKQERIRATYLHACLRYVEHDYMTNATLRGRFGIEEQNSAMASRIIKDAMAAEAVKQFDESAGRKYMKYVPWWA